MRQVRVLLSRVYPDEHDDTHSPCSTSRSPLHARHDADPPLTREHVLQLVLQLHDAVVTLSFPLLQYDTSEQPVTAQLIKSQHTINQIMLHTHLPGLACGAAAAWSSYPRQSNARVCAALRPNHNSTTAWHGRALQEAVRAEVAKRHLS